MYRITVPPPKGKGQLKIETVVDEKKLPGLKTPNGLAMDGQSHILLADFEAGFLYRIKLADST